jgi:hypothetical protein
MAREEEAIKQTITKYIERFQTLDPYATSPISISRVCLIPAEVRVLATAGRS